MSILVVTIVTCLYALACLLFGLRLIQLIAPASTSHRVVRVSTAFILGQVILAAIWQIVALVGMFNIPVVSGILVLAALSGVMPGIRLMQLQTETFNLSNNLTVWLNASWLWKLTSIFAVALIAITLIYTYMPPSAGDALAFYMAYPRIIAETGQLLVVEAIDQKTNNLQIGLQGEFHYAVMFLFGNDIAPELFNWITTMSGVVLLLALAEQCGIDWRGKWILILLLFTTSAFVTTIYDGKIDNFPTTVAIAAYFWALQVGKTYKGEIRLSGLFTGFAIIGKLSYAVFLPITIALLIFWRFYSQLPQEQKGYPALKILFRIGLILAFWGALPAFPHMMKNAALFDAPLTPVIAGDTDTLVIEQSWFNADTTNRILVTYPFSLTFGSFWAQNAQISPLFLAFVPLLFFIYSPNPEQRSLLIQLSVFGVLGIFIWVAFRATVFAPRYILPPLILLTIPITISAISVLDNPNRSKVALLVPVSLILVSVIFLNLERNRWVPTVEALVGGQVHDCIDAFTGSSCKVGRALNATAEPGARLLMMGVWSNYWIRGDLLQCAPDPSIWYTFEGWEEPADITWEEIYQQNFEYLFFNMTTHGDMKDSLLSQIPEWVSLEQIYDDGWQSAYHIQMDRDDARAVNYQCVETSPNIWQVVEQVNTRDEQ